MNEPESPDAPLDRTVAKERARKACSVCMHPARTTIDAAIREGATKRNLASRYGLSASAVHRHRAEHVHRALIPTRDLNALTRKAAHAVVDGVLKGSGVVQELGRLKQRADALGQQAEALGPDGVSRDPRVALQAIRELTRILELQARLAIQASEGRAQDLASNPIWHAVMGDLMLALAPFPEAQAAVIARVSARLGYPLEPQVLDTTSDPRVR